MRDDEGEALSDLAIRETIAGLLIAGYETTAQTLSWVGNEITRSPEVLEHLTETAQGDDGAWLEGFGRLPLLVGCAVNVECERISHQDAGDHRLYIGRVLRVQAQPVPPLVFHRGHYHLLGEVL